MAKKSREDLDIELNEFCDRLETAGMAVTKRWSVLWKESLQYFFSDQLHGHKKHKDWDWVILNYIWPTAMNEIAKLSKNNPKIICSPWEQSDTEAAEAWQSKLQWDWQQGINGHGMRLEQIAAILDGKLFGYRVSKILWEDKCYWDDKTKQWLGDVKHKLWHPACFWVSPEAERIDEAKACGTFRWVTLEWAQSRWPKHKEELESEAVTYREGPAISGWGPSIRGQMAAPGTTAGYGGQDTGVEDTSRAGYILDLIADYDKMSVRHNHEDDTKYVKLSEIYFKDYTEKHVKVEGDIPAEQLTASGAIYEKDGIFYDKKNKPVMLEDWPKQTVAEYDEPLYPKGRYVLRAGKTILNRDQIYPYSRWPFVVVPHYLLPHMWQGIGAAPLVKDTQDWLNVTVSHLTNYMKYFGDPKIAVEDGAIALNPKTRRAFKIGAGAGAIIRVVKGALSGRAPRYKIENPPAISPAVFSLYQLFAQEYKNLSGLQSIARGEKMPGKMSATEAHNLAISAEDRIALQSVYEDEWVKGVCRLIAEICQDKYDEGRFVRIVGEDNTAGVMQITQREKEVKFDVNIIPGTTLPFDEEKRLQKMMMAYQMLQQPIANPMLPEMLQALEIPNWKKLLERYQSWTQFAQFLQLYEAVKAGQIQPQQAVQMLVQKAMQVYQGEQQSLQGQIAQGEQQSAS